MDESQCLRGFPLSCGVLSSSLHFPPLESNIYAHIYAHFSDARRAVFAGQTDCRTPAATPGRVAPCAWRRPSLRDAQRPWRRREGPCRARGVRGCVRRRDDPKAGFVRLWRRAKRPCARSSPATRADGRTVARAARSSPARGGVFRFEATEPRSVKKWRRGRGERIPLAFERGRC